MHFVEIFKHIKSQKGVPVHVRKLFYVIQSNNFHRGEKEKLLFIKLLGKHIYSNTNYHSKC